MKDEQIDGQMNRCDTIKQKNQTTRQAKQKKEIEGLRIDC